VSKLPPADRRYFAAFLDLADKPGIVVGGGAVAAAKVRTLLRSGVRVTVVAPDLEPSLAELALLGAIRHEPRRFQPGDLVGAEVAIAAADDPAANEAVAHAARALRIPVNVADDPAQSSFVMPALVDRPPLQIAISTAGASPVLARKLRKLIEMAVPAGFGRLAALVGRMRRFARERIPDLAARRRFWEEVLDSSIAEEAIAGREEQAERSIERLLADPASTPTGMVYLVGGGPGNPDLLTLRALHVLQRAEVVLYDHLVSKAILELVRREAELVYVGKEADCHALTQEQINALLVHHARAGRRVVRLKGGDPFIFGRGGEEIESLAAEGIPFEVVPGVTAAAGAAAYAGIPLTHRDYAHACVFATGHLKDGAPELDWSALARPRQTVAIYMGVKALPVICQRLVEHGLAAETPAALVEQATLERQRVLTGTLATLPDLAARVGARPPALVIVGEVVRLRGRLAWYTARPRARAEVDSEAGA